MVSSKSKVESPSSVVFNLLCNIIVPVIILSKYSDEKHLGIYLGLGIALAFPISYGVYDFVKKRKYNFISVLGLVSVLLTGGLAVLKLNVFWFAIKEACIPFFIGVGVIGSLKTRNPLVKTMLYNPNVFDVDIIENHLKESDSEALFNKLLVNSTMLLALSFFVSAVLNFILAKVILQSPVGTTEFNQELGRMTALSFPVIMVPSMIVLFASLWYFIRGIKRITGLNFGEIIKNHDEN